MLRSPTHLTLRAVVLAAGDGDRMGAHTAALPKPLLPLAGRPIIEYVLGGLFAAGVHETTIVVGYRADQLRDALGAHSREGLKLRFVENEAYAAGNARSLWTARHGMEDGFLLAMGDHLVAPGITRAVIAGADGRCRLAVDRAGPGDPRAGEATRVRVRDGRVVEIGKSLREWDALDSGTFWCTPDIFEAIDARGRDGELADAFATIARAGALDAVDVSGQRWVDIDTPADLRRAEAMLEADGRFA
ncbi:MAG: NTP transferase domain-containing protein [Dehalococcoidia bacterium]|nr:NTP transferase domain-containing protein [Dehalococcoidia bacterium]